MTTLMHRSPTIIFIILFSFCIPSLQARDLMSQAIPGHSITHQSEILLIEALNNIKDHHINDALSDLELLVRKEPNFKLAQLMYADMLLSRSRPINDFGNNPALPREYIALLKEEARARWQHHVAPPVRDAVPDFLVQLSNDQQYVITVDQSASRLYLFENRKGTPSLISDFYVSIGKNGFGKYEQGDQKTPVGVYFINSAIDPGQLPDFYGDGAFPLDYPNEWDKRFNRTGYGIWLHGTPHNIYSRPPRDSNGCVILSNPDLKLLEPYLVTGKTPVLLADRINWIPLATWQIHQREYRQFIEQWRKDWESRNVESYLSHYSREYSGLGKSYKDWVAHKRRVTPANRFIKVNLYNTSLFLYPGEPGLLVATFLQDYRSDGFQKRFVKRQYWRRDKDGRWRIVYEGSVS